MVRARARAWLNPALLRAPAPAPAPARPRQTRPRQTRPRQTRPRQTRSAARLRRAARYRDWSYESCIVTLLRETGPGFRMGFFLSSLYVVVVTAFTTGAPLVFQYDLKHPSSDMRFGNMILGVAFYLWTLDFALLTLSYYLIRHFGPRAASWCWRPPQVRELREQRAVHPCTLWRTATLAFYAVFFVAYFLLAVFAMHTTLAHMYVKQNVWFAWLLLVKAVMVVFASIDDLTHIGSPWGIQEASQTASVLLSFRGIYLVPVTMIWTAAAVVASFPPAYCRTC